MLVFPITKPATLSYPKISDALLAFFFSQVFFHRFVLLFWKSSKTVRPE